MYVALAELLSAGNSADARVPHVVARVLPLLFRLVWRGATHAGDPRRAGTLQIADQMGHHRLGRDHDRGPPHHRLALRPHRSALDLYVAARAGLAAGDGHRFGAEF